MNKAQKIQKGVFPLTTITEKKWWENPNANADLTKGGAIATQEQCSCNGNGGGGGNGTCGTRWK